MYSRWFLTALATVTLGSALELAADSAPVASGDWPGWHGLERTGVSRETGLLRQWPPGGPKLLWKGTGWGGGYSTPSIAAGRLFVMGSRGGDEYVLALRKAGSGSRTGAVFPRFAIPWSRVVGFICGMRMCCSVTM